MSMWLFVACRSAAPGDVAELRVYDGEISVEGHFRRPGETQTYQTELRFASEPGAVHLAWTTWQAADRSDAGTEHVWLVGDLVLRGEETLATLSGDAARDARELALAGRPDEGVVVERAYGHPRLGDVTDRVRHGADELVIERHELDHEWTANLQLVSAGAGEPLVVPEIPAGVPAAELAPAQLAPVAEGVWEVVVPASDTRSLVVALDSGLVVLEASLTSPLGEQVVDVIRAKLPGKPIRYVSFGHYHPHYTGGLRAFLAEGATVLTTPGNEALVRTIGARPFTRVPDRLATAPGGKVEVFEGSRDLEGHVELIDIGAASDHTDEYVVFYLPKARLLFQGDLGYFANPDGTIRAPARSRGLLQVVRERGLVVDNVVQGWPVAGQPRMVSFRDWEAAVGVLE